MTDSARQYPFSRLPGQFYLWLAVCIFGASNAVTRKLTEIGSQHAIDGRNPISLCNVLFVGNLCALVVLVIIHRQQWTHAVLKRLSNQEWLSLVLVAILAGAIAPGLIFQALAVTGANTVVLVGRLEPPLTLALSVWLLQERVNAWEVIGAISTFVGVVLTIFLQPATQPMIAMGSVGLGLGELLAALGAIALAVSTIIGKKRLTQVPLGIYSVVRTALGTVVFFLTALGLYGSHHFMDALSPFLWQWMVVYGVVIVVVGQGLWLYGLRRTPLSVASLVSSFTPIAGILAAYLILSEAPTTAQYLGGSVMVLGLGLSQVGLQRRMARMAHDRRREGPTEAEIESGMGFKGI